MFTFQLLSLFPEETASFFQKGIFKRAIQEQCFRFNVINLRSFGIGNYKTVDGPPFGGREGMILRSDVVVEAVKSIDHFEQYRIIYTCPKGPRYNQARSRDYLSEKKGLIIIPGYYEGIDERIFELLPVEQVSVGDFILSSGEIPALAIIDSMARQLPGVLGNPECVRNESIVSGVLEHAQYTQPKELESLGVPEVLVSGHHQNIRRWKRDNALARTLFSRPDMLSREHLDEADRETLTQLFKGEMSEHGAFKF